VPQNCLVNSKTGVISYYETSPCEIRTSSRISFHHLNLVRFTYFLTFFVKWHFVTFCDIICLMERKRLKWLKRRYLHAFRKIIILIILWHFHLSNHFIKFCDVFRFGDILWQLFAFNFIQMLECILQITTTIITNIVS